MNVTRLINAFHEVIKALETPADESTPPAQPPATSEAAASPKPRGRPRGGPKVEGATPTAPAASAAASDDPFADAPAAPVATLDEVRAALKALQAVTDQATAVGVLKAASGADNLASLKADKHGAVVVAAKAAMPMTATEVLASEPPDPFETPTAPAVVAEALPTREEIRAIVIAKGKETSQDTIQKLLMSMGGSAVGGNGQPGPSLLALPESKFVEFVAAVKALPKTK